MYEIRHEIELFDAIATESTIMQPLGQPRAVTKDHSFCYVYGVAPSGPATEAAIYTVSACLGNERHTACIGRSVTGIMPVWIGGREMFEAQETAARIGKRDAAADSRGGRERKQKFDIVDLYEELLAQRSDMGYRPVLYVSSERDLECNLIGMFESTGHDEFSGEAIPASRTVEELRRRLG